MMIECISLSVNRWHKDCIRVDRVVIEFYREPLDDPEESSL